MENSHRCHICESGGFFTNIKKHPIWSGIALFVFIAIITLCAYLLFRYDGEWGTVIDFLGMVATFSAIIIGIITLKIGIGTLKAAVNQVDATMRELETSADWNKRHAAMTVAREIKENIKQDVDVIDRHFNFLQLEPKTSIQVEDIHKKICVLENDKMKIYQDKKGRIDYEGEGHEIYRSITNILNAYEYMATCIYQNIFDKELLTALYRGPIISAYYAFEDYIKHYNEKMKPERNGKVWVNFKHLAESFIKEEDEKKKENQQPDKRPAAGSK